MKCVLTTIIGMLLASGIDSARAQKSGQSISIVHGTVISTRSVQLQSEAPKGALVGGTIGYLSSRGKSSRKKNRNALIGAAAGSAVASSAQGSRSAREYTVETSTGAVKIISDQTQIRFGDCVVVENAGSNKANIRRTSPTYCEPESAEVVVELHEEALEEAEECLSAKQELAAAVDDNAFDRAIRKVAILCDN